VKTLINLLKELKHLNTSRKINQYEIMIVVANEFIKSLKIKKVI